MRKQFLTIICVAVVSFLFGTLFSMGFTAIGILSNPFENRLNDGMQAEIIRFNDPKEINVTWRQPSSFNLSRFVWTPRIPQDNSILEVYYQFEYRCENPEWHKEYPRSYRQYPKFRINGDIMGGFDGVFLISAGNQEEWERKNYTRWQWFSFSAEPTKDGQSISPNQKNYTIGFDWHDQYPACKQYVRNINVILEVIDG